MSKLFRQIRQKVTDGLWEFSQHSVDQSILRNISVSDVREAILNGPIIEDFPDDKYGPSCLVLGYTTTGRPLHIQCSHPERPLVKIITLYQPSSARWINDRERKT